MKSTERIIIVLLLLCFIGAGAWGYFSVRHKQLEMVAAVARGEFQIPDQSTEETAVAAEDWRQVYPNTVPLRIGEVSVQASVASTLSTRIKGLSDTPYLPDNVVKLFAFGAAGQHSIWMKDMNYAIDIIWVAAQGEIVYIEEQVSPDTYPQSFASPTPAWYVVETVAGFVETNGIQVGDKVVLQNL